MNTLSLKAKTTKAIMLVIILGSLFLAACDPSKIVTTNTDVERKMKDWTVETCRQRPDGTCKLMGEK